MRSSRTACAHCPEGDAGRRSGRWLAMGHPTIAAVCRRVDAGACSIPPSRRASLSEQRERIHFEHPLLAEAAYRLLPPSRRRGIHERLAAVATDVEERARHLAAASTTPDARRGRRHRGRAREAAAARRAGRSRASSWRHRLVSSPTLEIAAPPARSTRCGSTRGRATGGARSRSRRRLVDELPPVRCARARSSRAAEQEGRVEELSGSAAQAVDRGGRRQRGADRGAPDQGPVPPASRATMRRRYECIEARIRAVRPRAAPRALRIQAMSCYGEYAQWRGEPDWHGAPARGS